VYSCLR